MTKSDKSQAQSPAPAPANRRAQILWVAVPVVVVLLGAVVFLTIMARNSTLRRVHVRELQQANTAMGLPLDYPQDVVPIYAGAKIEETSRDTTMSEDDQPLDQWTIVARVEGPPKPVYEYYKALMEGRGMQQMLFASIPKGYAIQYSDEQYRVEFEIEKPKSSDTFTRLKIVLYRVQE